MISASSNAPIGWCTWSTARIVSDVVLHDALRICEFLRAVDLFRALTPTQLTDVAEKMKKRQFAAGETIIREGEPGEEFFLISDGEVDVVRADHEVARLGRGEFFGEVALISGEPRNATVVATEPLDTFVLGKADFQSAVVLERIFPRPALPRLFRAPLTRAPGCAKWSHRTRDRDPQASFAASPHLPVAANRLCAGAWPRSHPHAGREEIESRSRRLAAAPRRGCATASCFCSCSRLVAGVAAGTGRRPHRLAARLASGTLLLPFRTRASQRSRPPSEPARLLLMPVMGGMLVGLSSVLLRRWRPREVVDAIEANALFGGRMSLGDSLGLVWVTILSGGFGASVGLEAAYTQLGAALASRLGRSVDLRRDDVRTLVGCGAAGAIAAAFNAPLSGAFYAFELIIGSYTLQALAPVGIAALTGALVVRGLVGSNPIFVVWHDIALSPSDYLAFFGVGLASAGLGILTMKGVTSTEALFRSQAVPRWARPALGGLIVGLIALPFPQVLGSGHGGILSALHSGFDLPFLAGLIVAKIIASAISIGSGFRGGLFSSSLFLGSLFGSLIGGLLTRLGPGLAADPLIYALVGMGAVAAAIVGAPMTMIMLVLETTGDFSATIGVMVGVVTAAIAVRHWFGYSFATWRFHLRGLAIRSPEDVGWINELLIGPMMRRDPAVISADLPLDELRRRFPAGSTKQVFVVDGDGRLSGIIDPSRDERLGRRRRGQNRRRSGFGTRPVSVAGRRSAHRPRPLQPGGAGDAAGHRQPRWPPGHRLFERGLRAAPLRARARTPSRRAAGRCRDFQPHQPRNSTAPRAQK